MRMITAENWWAALPKREQSRRKDALVPGLEARGIDIPDSDYSWANAAYEAEHA